MTVIGDYAFIPTYWRARRAAPTRTGCRRAATHPFTLSVRPTILDDAEDKARILAAQLADFQPEGRHATSRGR